MTETMARAICERALAQTQLRLASKGEVWEPSAEQWQEMIDCHMEADFGDEYREQARAALAAMREPTEAMAIAASSWVCDGNANGAQWIDTADIYPMWTAAINAALQETSE